jgi:Tfp pilus assembly protein PilF
MNAVHDARFPFYLGLSYMQDGQPQQPARAMEYFKEAFVVAPRHPLPHHYMGLLLARQGRWPEAQVHFLKATQADPTYPDPQLQFARSLEKTGDLAQAKEQLGVYYFLKDDAYQAAGAFRAMVTADPKSVQAPRLVSLAFLRLGRNDWAIRETKAALQQHPRDVTLLERLATLYILTHSRPPARSICEEWLKIQPGAPRAHWLLGRVAQDDLKRPEAIHEYELAVAGDPGNPEYQAALAAALNDTGGTANQRRAGDLLQQAVRLDPRTVSYRHDLGMTLQQLGDLEGARRQFLAALDRDPHHAPSYSGISQLCVRLRRPALARFFGPLVRAAQDRSREEVRLSRRIGQNPTSPEAHDAMAEFLIREAAFPAAQSHLERALELRPNYPEARAALTHVKRAIDVQ